MARRADPTESISPSAETGADGGRTAKAATRAWLAEQTMLGRRATRPTIAFSVSAALCGIGQAACAAVILAEALVPAVAPETSHSAAAPLIGFALLAVTRAALAFAAERAAIDAGAGARRRLRTELMDRVLAIGPSLLRARHSADLAALAVDRVEALDGLFARYIPAIVLAFAIPVLVVIAALVVDPMAALVLVLTGVLVPIAMAGAGIGAGIAARDQFVAMQRLQVRFIDRVRGIGTIVLAGRAEDEARVLGVAAAELRVRTMRVLRVAFLSSVALDLAAAAAIIALALRYAAQYRAGTLGTPVAALFCLLLVPEFFAPLRAFAAAYSDRFAAQAAAEAIIGLPALPTIAAPPAGVRTITARGVTVAFEDVGFTWDPARGPTLDHISFRVPAGETLLLTGPSGAGKSTIIEILLGTIRPTQGRATLNGVDIADLVPQALARLTAWIGQRPVLFAGTIAENIAFARPEASAAEIAAAAESARINSFTDRLPLGLDTVIGEGGYGLSGGQAQRVAIARAFLKSAPLLLLDEPTAHLDPATEAEVLDSLRRLAVGRTVIVASHATAAHAFAGPHAIGHRRLELRDGRVEPVRGAA